MSKKQIGTGRCLCGAVRFEAIWPVTTVVHCHCESCRRSTGAPFVTHVGFGGDGFSYINDEPAEYRSSPGVRRTFCGRCGTPMTYENSNWPSNTVYVNISTLDDPNAYRPQLHVHCREAISWLRIDDQLPRHSELPEAEKAG